MLYTATWVQYVGDVNIANDQERKAEIEQWWEEESGAWLGSDEGYETECTRVSAVDNNHWRVTLVIDDEQLQFLNALTKKATIRKKQK